MSEASPAELLDWARRAASDPGGGWGRSWARVSAFLARTALERALRDFWTGQLAPMGWAPTSVQLLCLPAYLDEPALARALYGTWAQLSRACHAHPYELPPTVDEIGSWVGVVERFAGLGTEEAAP
ncbi:MAG: hypothetical protein M0005_05415 [Actinomycetota bacterium]|jgi:hypothetical protein|nr:hypothetical protein [Actinomycetota bacterium]